MNCGEAVNEIRRDLAEMGLDVHPHSYQNKIVADDPNFATKELTNYVYSVVDPDLADLPNIDSDWVKAEAGERFSGKRINPGEAYKLRYDVWKEFLVDDGSRFDYTYPERLNPSVPGSLCNIDQIQRVVDELANNPDSRQCFISIWNPLDITEMGGIRRIPCSLGYLVQVRGGKLQITYLQRSSDFATHFQNDVALSIALANCISARLKSKYSLDYPVGLFTHWIGSLHVYHKDIKTVF